MFNQTVFLHCAIFIESLSKRHAFYKRFVFDENKNDLVSLHGLQYDQEDFHGANGQNISIVGTRNLEFSQMFIIDLLQQIIHFNKKIYYDQQNWQRDVLLGVYDMNLVTYSSSLAYQTLLPTTSGSHQLFVVNLEMIGTPTYFVEIFDVYLWIGFLASFTLIGVLSILGKYLLQRYTTTRFNYMGLYSVLTNQGGDENSRLIFQKLLLVSLSVITIIFHGSFGAFLSSYLAIRNPDLPFTTLDGLIKSPDYSICTPYGTSSYTYFIHHLKSDGAIRHRVNNKYCPNEFKQLKVFTQHDKFKDFCPLDKTVFFIPAVIDISNEKCPAFNFIPLNEQYAKQYYTILVSPGFKYREQFNRGLLRLHTAGFIKRDELKKHKARHNTERRVERLEHDPRIDFHQTQIILLIPVVGIILGVVILMIELLIKNY